MESQMKEQKQYIYEYAEVEGCYGPRYAVPKLCKSAINIFEAVKVWTSDVRIINGVRCTVYELPFGQRVQDNPLIMYWLTAANIRIIGPQHMCK